MSGDPQCDLVTVVTGGWGPFVTGIDPAERRARLRSLRMAVRLLCGPRGAGCRHRLQVAELALSGPDELAEAEAAFERLGSLDRRRVLASYAAEAA